MNFLLIVAFVIYSVILCLIGFICHLKTSSSTEFALGNRSVNYWVTAIAAHASDMSAWLFMGFPAAVYNQGLLATWIAIGLVIGMFASWHLIAHRLRVMTEYYQAVTISSFLQKRFDDRSNLIPQISALVTVLFFIVYLAAGLTGMGYVFETVFNINYRTGMAMGLIVSLFYIMIGGFVAVAWNHFFQGMFLLAMIIIVPVYAWYQLPSSILITSNITQHSLALSLLPKLTYQHCIAIINGLSWGIGYLGMPHVIVNFMGIDNPDHIKRARYLGMAWLIISLACAAAVGFIAIGYFSHVENSELVFVYLVQKLFSPLLVGFILCAILAATMSTIDTQILVSSSAITQDLIPVSWRMNNSMWLSHISTLVIALVSFCLAWTKNATVMGLVSCAWSGLASAFSPIMIAALYSNYVTKAGALASIISGSITALMWPLINTDLLPLIPGVIASTLALYIVSFITRKTY